MIYCFRQVSIIRAKSEFFGVTFIAVGRKDQKMGSALMPIEGLLLLLAAIQAQVIVKGIRRNETTTIKTVRKRRSCVIKLCKVECFATTRW